MQGLFHRILRGKVSSSPRANEKEAGGKNVSSSCSPQKPPQSHSALTSAVRWSRKYDVFVCHSSVHTDTEEAVRLVSYLEAPPQKLRCFLWHRDACPGSAVATELCQAVQDSHCKALLITRDFLHDSWCKYMMHQALSEAPMSGRTIPMIHNLHHTEYPQELMTFTYIDLNKNTSHAYARVRASILHYLEHQLKKEDCRTDSSSKERDEESSTQVTERMSECDPTSSSCSLQLSETTDESLLDL